jgi:transcription initiation factor TFIID TATA-box-binding protein
LRSPRAWARIACFGCAEWEPALNTSLYTIYMSMTRIRIENVVASASIGEGLDLQSIALALEGSDYDPEAFPGLIYRLTDPRTAILLFRSGKLVCTGGKSMKHVLDSVRKVSKLIRAAGQKVASQPKIQVQNIVATSDLESEIDLNTVAITLGLDRVEYEPEQFPGLVYRLEAPHVVLLLFGSGKLVCTGARRPSDIGLAVERLSSELETAGLINRARSSPHLDVARSPGTARPVVPALGSRVTENAEIPSTSTTGMTA